MSKASGKEKFQCVGGPWSGESLWLSGPTMEFTTITRKPKSYLNRTERVDTWRGYYTCKPYSYSKTKECTWVNTTPPPEYKFESRENINGFSNGL